VGDTQRILLQNYISNILTKVQIVGRAHAIVRARSGIWAGGIYYGKFDLTKISYELVGL